MLADAPAGKAFKARPDQAFTGNDKGKHIAANKKPVVDK